MLLTAKSCSRPSILSTHSRFLSRRYNSQETLKPVDLTFERVKSESSAGHTGPLLICHGLFGSKQNWRSLSKTFATRLGTDVFALDLRNHGTSPHSDTMDYTSMASDVLHFCHKHNLSNISLLGHSMGGKVAMALALNPTLPPTLLSHLIITDIAPSKGALSPEFRNYTDAMQRVEQAKVKSRKEANDIIQEVEPDMSIRAFLLTNIFTTRPGGTFKFRVPVDTIKRSLDDIGGFPYEPGEREWGGKTLLIKGEKSKYVNNRNIPLAKRFFPGLKFEILNTGHWVHAEKPHDFVDLVVDFIKNS